MFNTITPLGAYRRQTQLWYRSTGYNGNFCGLYNDGKKLYAWPQELPPGSFVNPPHMLHHVPFQTACTKLRDVTFVHKGHMNGIYGGDACVLAYQGTIERGVLLSIPQLSIIYVIPISGELKVHVQPAIFPSTVLAW